MTWVRARRGGWRHLFEEDQVQMIELEHVYVFLALFYLFFLCCGIFSIIKLLSAAVVCPGHRMTGISSEFYRAIARNGSRPVEILPNSCIFLGVLTGSCLLLHHHFLCSGFGGMFRIDELNQVKNTCTSFCAVIL
jgi:hypothetical protein